MNNYRLFLNMILIAGIVSCPVVANEKGGSSPPALIIAAFIDSAGPSLEIDVLSELEMEASEARITSMVATFNGFDWYSGRRGEAHRSLSLGGSCLSCSARYILSH
jgi:hypothetical protein